MLDGLRQSGKIRHYGVSVEKVEEGLKAIEYPGVVSIQIIFNAFRQRPAELFFQEAARREVGVLARVPLSSGMLTGKMGETTEFEDDDHRSFNRDGEAFDRGETFSGLDYATGLQAVEGLRPLVPEGWSMTQMVLRWILMFPEVTCAIPGAKRAEQVIENTIASDLPPLCDEAMAVIDNIYRDNIKEHVHQYW